VIVEVPREVTIVWQQKNASRWHPWHKIHGVEFEQNHLHRNQFDPKHKNKSQLKQVEWPVSLSLQDKSIALQGAGIGHSKSDRSHSHGSNTKMLRPEAQPPSRWRP
jgi:hypothetical protein